MNHERPAKKLLIVDDEPSVRESVELLMTTLGFEVTTAECGKTAVELFEGQDRRFDCAIVDVSMPEMDGIETAERIRSIHPNLPIVFSSGYSEAAIPDELLQQPNTVMIRKPYRSDAIIRLLEEIST